MTVIDDVFVAVTCVVIEGDLDVIVVTPKSIGDAPRPGKIINIRNGLINN